VTDSEQSKTEFSIIEELTAYLDGELDQSSMERVEIRLGKDPEYLAEMQALQKTWDLLDAVPHAEPGASFTKTTMELVVGEAVKSVRKKRASWVWPIRIAVMLVIPSLLFVTAYGIIRQLQAQPDQILIDNLGLIENLPRYEAIEYDMEFLDLLSKRSPFPDSTLMVDEKGALIGMNDGPIESKYLVPDSPEQRRVYVESLDVQQLVKLKRKFQDFQKLTPEVHSQLSQFDATLNASENHEELLMTLQAYYDWLLKVESGEKSRLRDLDGKDRVDAIVAIRNRQSLDAFGKEMLSKLPSPDDAEPILGWSESLFRLNERSIREQFGVAVVKYAQSIGLGTPSADYVRRKSTQGNLHILVDFLMRVDRSFVENMLMKPGDVQLLYNLLSEKAKREFDDQSSDGQRDLILNWVESVIQSKRGVPIELLKKFERRLSREQRDKLAKMSTENYVATLQQMFLQQEKSNLPIRWDDESIDDILQKLKRRNSQ
jgi:hypothetical protein